MAARFVTTTVVALLIPALTLLCLGDVVKAALPNVLLLHENVVG